MSDDPFPGWKPQLERRELVRGGKVPRFDGCSLRDWQNKHDKMSFDVAKVSSNRIPREEVQKHTDPDSLWMVIQGVVYDVTSFQLFHPGGEKILRQCSGKDVTDLYATYHRWVSCEGTIGKLAIGILDVQSE